MGGMDAFGVEESPEQRWNDVRMNVALNQNMAMDLSIPRQGLGLRA